MMRYPYRVFLRGINQFMLVYEPENHIKHLWERIKKAIDEDDMIIFTGYDQRTIRMTSAICTASEVVAIDDMLPLDPLDVENALRNQKKMSDNSMKTQPKEIGQSVSKRKRK